MGGKHQEKNCEKEQWERTVGNKTKEKTRENHREKQRGVMRD